MSPQEKYRRVLEPLKVGKLTFKNRIFVPAHTTNFGRDHQPSDLHRAYHEARARGGVGAIIFESIRVQKNSLGRPQCVSGIDPEVVERFRPIVEAVHAHDVRLLGQVIHVGRQIDGDFERTASYGPSPIPWSITSNPPHVMDEEDMDEVIDSHVQTSLNLIEAGFDGFEVHVGHGHLLQQFLSPLSNQRQDAYGGSTENRMRFPLRVLQAVRAAIGTDVCMGIRVSADEYAPGGLELAEMCRVVPALAAAVQLDFVNVSHSAYHASYSLATQMADMAFDPATFRGNGAAIRAALREMGHEVPVLAVCKYRTLAEAEEALAEGWADAVGMARAHVAEPELVKRTLEDREDEIRPCINCNQGCAAMNEKNLPIRCTVNPRTGLEDSWGEVEAAPAASPRDVLVIGGGPAGMEAAWTAAARGHRVRLWERGERLGGQLNGVRPMPARHDYLKLLGFQEGMLRRHGVDIVLGREATPASVEAERPDVVVLATGAVEQPLPYSSTAGAFALPDALARPAELGQQVAVVDLNGTWAAIATIEHLADLGKKVVVFVPAASFSWRTTVYSTLATMKRLREKGVRIALMRRVRDWAQGILVVEDTSTGDIEELRGFDSVVVSQWPRAEDALRGPLRRMGIEVRSVGDCLAPRSAMEAVFEGQEAARAI